MMADAEKFSSTGGYLSSWTSTIWGYAEDVDTYNLIP